MTALVSVAVLTAVTSATPPPESVARQFANCPSCLVLGSARVSLAESRREAYSFKLLDEATHAGTLVTLLLNPNGDIVQVDESTLLEEERIIRTRKYGKRTQSLAASSSRAPAQTLVAIWIWTKVRLEYPIKETITPAVRAAWEADRDTKIAAANEPVLLFLRSAGYTILEASAESPLIRALVPISAIGVIDSFPTVEAIGDEVWPPVPLSTNYYDAVRAPAAQSFSTGATKTSDQYGCKPDDYADLVVVDTASANSCTDWHVRWTTGIIRNRGTPAGTNPGAISYISNWDNYNTSGRTEPSTEHWAMAQGVRPFNYSHSANNGAPGPVSANGTSMKFDFQAKNSPFPLWVQAAGNSGNVAGFDAVQNRSMNGIVVGASDDKGTISIGDDDMAPFSSWRNPTGSHGDFELPNLSAPGVNITAAGSTASGTSAAAPIVAGCLGYAYARDTTFSSWPELGRAVSMATAVHGLVGQPAFEQLSSVLPDARQGVGLVHCASIAQLADPANDRSPGSAAANRGRNQRTVVFAADFDANGDSLFSWNLVADFPGRLRVVVAFDSTAGGCSQTTGDNCTSDTLDADLDLHIRRSLDNSMVCSSNSFDSSWEGCDFAVAAGETFTARIRKFSTNAAQTYLGIAWFNWIPGSE